MTLQVTDAIVLHAFDYLETSRIVRLATREAGLQSVIARGARRSTRRFGAAMDLFASGVAELRVRDGRDLQQLTAFDVTNARSGLAHDLDRFAAASMLCELALRCSAGEEHGELYLALSRALDDLAATTGVTARVTGLGAAWRVIAALGFAPSLDACALCHQAIPAAHEALFSHVAGGVTCTACEAQVRGGRRLPASARAQLIAWVAGQPGEPPDDASQRAHVRLLREFLQYHVAEGAELRAFAAWSSRFG